eukprot:PhF_6_TR11147/c0_g1_i1/m.17970
MSEQNLAAARIQALHRGTKARHEVKSMKEEKKKQDVAAIRIQSLQRGRQAREKAQAVRSELSLFRSPAEIETAKYVILGASMEALRRRVDSWEAFVQPLRELLAPRQFDDTKFLYSTEPDTPSTFGNTINKEKFEALKLYDSKRREADKAKKEHDMIEKQKAAEIAALPPPPPVPEGEDPPPPPQKTKKQLKAEAERKKADAARVQNMLQLEYEVQCLHLKLTNLLQLKFIRVDY